jgi:large subunit ribosomal protein L4
MEIAMAAVLDLKGKQVGDLKLSEQIFAQTDEAKATGTMHAALVRQLGNARVGSANTKTRAEVRGGGAKPWRQKGTGRARAGSRRSPLWAGGGVIFGPKPRDYTSSMPAKMRHNAIKSALAVQADNLIVVNDFSGHKEIKTKEAAKVLQALKIDDKRVLVVVEPKNEDAKRFGLSVRNMENVTVVRASNLGVKELLDCETILTSQGAIEFITKWLDPVKKEKIAKKKTDSKAKTEAKSEHKAESKTEHKAEAKTEHKTEHKAESKTEHKTEAKTEHKTEHKAESKTEHKTEAKTDTKTEVKAKAPAPEKTAEKAHEKPSALQSIATTSKAKHTETTDAKKADSSAKPKKASDEGQNKGKGKGK